MAGKISGFEPGGAFPSQNPVPAAPNTGAANAFQNEVGRLGSVGPKSVAETLGSTPVQQVGQVTSSHVDAVATKFDDASMHVMSTLEDFQKDPSNPAAKQNVRQSLVKLDDSLKPIKQLLV